MCQTAISSSSSCSEGEHGGQSHDSSNDGHCKVTCLDVLSQKTLNLTEESTVANAVLFLDRPEVDGAFEVGQLALEDRYRVSKVFNLLVGILAVAIEGEVASRVILLTIYEELGLRVVPDAARILFLSDQHDCGPNLGVLVNIRVDLNVRAF